MTGCCSGGACSSPGPQPAPEQTLEIEPKDDSCSQTSCCDENCPSSSKGCHDEAGKQEVVTNECCNTRMCDSTSRDIASSSSISPMPTDCRSSYVPKISTCSDGDSESTCCVRKLGGQSSNDCSNRNNANKDTLKASEPISTIIEIQDSDATPGCERIVMDVQGMTCVGCEKNLRKALNSIAAVSNIKTSLLLCRAEFDLQNAEIWDANIVIMEIERMTGFACLRIMDMGEELELILGPEHSDYTLAPGHGASLNFRDGGRVFVTFNPHIIGARTLLSDSFFKHATLAPPRPSASVESGKTILRNAILMTLLSTVLTIPVLILAYGKLPKNEILYGSISLAFATIIQVVVAGPFYVRAFRTLLFSKMIEMDMLVVLSTTTAYAYSVIAFSFQVHGQPLSTGSFFETSTLLVTLIMVGQTLGKYARQQAVESISIESLQVSRAVIVDPKLRTEQNIDARLLQYGDIIKVLPEETFVTDGMILEGETEVDESLITGEACLVKKTPGSTVIAGSINHLGTVLVDLTRLPSENTIKTISTMVDEAKSSKPRVQEIADVFAGYFTPATVVVTIIVFIIWIAVGTRARHEKGSTACINAMTFAISTLIVSCPCAIGLAVPMVVVIACGVSARHGLILKRSEIIEMGHKISHVVLDKTGTLTEGHPSVIEEHYLDTSKAVTSVILGLTSSSKHPVSTAISKHLQDKGIQAAYLENVTSVPGSGVEGTWNGVTVRAGNQYQPGLPNSHEVHNILSRGLTILCITINHKLVAVFGLQDQLRPEALSVVSELQRRNIKISLISGDNNGAVNTIATQLSIPPENAHSHCSPLDKANYVKSLHSSSDLKATVLFVGDGTNDAVALAEASIGMHMNSGTDVAQSAADAIVLRSDLQSILTLIDLSKAFRRRVVFNFGWSILYNLFAVLLAAGAFESLGGVRIQPMYAGLGELVSVLPVIAVAVSLRWVRF